MKFLTNVSGQAFVGLALVCFAALLNSCGGKRFSQTVERLDLERFMGDWYVIAGRTTALEKGAHNALETYRWNKEKKRIDVEFTFRKNSFTGKLKRMTQKGWVVDKQTNATWEIQPFWPLRLGYLVIALGEDYSWTVIGVPNQKYLWIMARQAEMSEAQLSDIVTKLKQMNYRVDNVERVPQNWSLGVSGLSAPP